MHTPSSPTRRSMLALAFGLGVSGLAAAQAWPAKPIRIVVPFPPGGIMDINARAIGAEMGKRLAVAVIVENRPGAGGNLGTEAVAKAAPDGYTLLYGIGSTLTANPHLYPKLGFDPSRDLAPITETVSGGMVLLVRPDFPAASFAEWLAQVKRQPGRLSYASYGNGSFPHLNMELVKSLTGVHVVHIPYRGAAPAMQDFLAGQVDMMFDQTATALAQVRSGKARAIAVNTPQRLAALPDVPTLAETLRGFDGSGWQGLWAPAGTPPEVLQALNRTALEALAQPELRRRFAESGLEPVGSSPEQVTAKTRSESEKWRQVIRFARIQLD